MSMANRSAKRFFFSLRPRHCFRLAQLCRANLLTHGDQFPYQLAEAPILADLRFGAFDSGALGNDLGDRFSADPMGQRIRRTVSWGTLPSTVAVGLATLTESRGQKTGAQVADLGQASRKLITFFAERF